MNFKYYLRGLGTGIIVTLIIVTISNALRGSRQASEASAQPSSVQQTSAIEAILNNQKTTQADSTAEADGDTESETAEMGADGTGDTQRKTTGGNDSVTDDAGTSGSNTAQVTDNGQGDGHSITVSFESVRSSESAAQLLEKAGLVDNWRNFNSYLVNNGYDRKVLGGTFSFSGDESYEEIARIITKSR